MKKSIFLLTFMLCAAAVPADAQNCTSPTRCGELGYNKTKDDCTGKESLVCPFDGNKYFCVGSSAGVCPPALLCQNGCQRYSTQAGCSDVCISCKSLISKEDEAECRTLLTTSRSCPWDDYRICDKSELILYKDVSEQNVVFSGNSGYLRVRSKVTECPKLPEQNTLTINGLLELSDKADVTFELETKINQLNLSSTTSMPIVRFYRTAEISTVKINESGGISGPIVAPLAGSLKIDHLYADVGNGSSRQFIMISRDIDVGETHIIDFEVTNRSNTPGTEVLVGATNGGMINIDNLNVLYGTVRLSADNGGKVTVTNLIAADGTKIDVDLCLSGDAASGTVTINGEIYRGGGSGSRTVGNMVIYCVL